MKGTPVGVVAPVGSPSKNGLRTRNRRGSEADLAGFCEGFPPLRVGGYVPKREVWNLISLLRFFRHGQYYKGLWLNL